MKFHKISIKFQVDKNSFNLLCYRDSITEILLFISQVPLILFMSSITL